ncbi:MAG TPA: hypothetical protein VEP93_07030 [Variovorax sp.]|nr:hypothetical protein [Variovorax sp.]
MQGKATPLARTLHSPAQLLPSSVPAFGFSLISQIAAIECIPAMEKISHNASARNLRWMTKALTSIDEKQV